MSTTSHSLRRVVSLLSLVTLSLVTLPQAMWARQMPDVPVNAETVVGHVRQALGRGAVERARTLVTTTDAPATTLAVAAALVDLFEGRTDEARRRLASAVAEGDRGDALLELGLLDLQDGRRADGRRHLTALLQRTDDLTPAHALRRARAAHALSDVALANALFQRIGRVPLQQAEMETVWGDMLFERHQFGEAVRSYRAALEADAGWVRAYLGLSRALATEDRRGADEALERAGTLSPDHPEVWLLTAERRLDAGDRAGAAEALDRAAARRPGTWAERALRAAVVYADGDLPRATAMVEEAVASHPFFVDGFLRLGEAAARAYRFADAAGFARRAVALDAEHPGAHAALGLYLMRTGDEEDAREELERAFRLDPYDTVTYNLLTLLDTMASFVEVEEGPFVFKFARHEADVLAPYAVPLALEAYATFVDRYGFTPEGPILVEVFPRHDDFAVRTMGLPGLEMALGACFGRVIAMDSPSAREPGTFSWQATLWHEIAHVFSLQASNYRVPRWLTEGISVYEEHRYNKAWGRELALEFARAVAAKRTFGVAGLPNAFQRPRDMALAYFEASLLTEHLVSMHGDAGLRALLAAYADGARDAEAFARAFSRTVAEVETSFAAFVEAEYGALARAMATPEALRGLESPPSLEVLRTLAAQHPGSFLVQLSLGQALQAQGELDGAREALTRAAALAPMAQGDNSPRSLLASIALQQGDADGARRELSALLEWDHDNVGAARRLLPVARATSDQAGEEQALRLIADVYPFDADAHAALGRLALARKDYAAALKALRASLALGPPNPAEAHADVAEAYLGLGRRDEARRAALRALEFAPTYSRAQDVLLAAIGGRQ